MWKLFRGNKTELELRDHDHSICILRSKQEALQSFEKLGSQKDGDNSTWIAETFDVLLDLFNKTYWAGKL